MGAFFESALLFSLAVLIILVGLLIYYFKGRIVDIEQKNIKCLDIINDVYKSHLEFKQMVKNEFENLIIGGGTSVTEPPKQVDNRIKVEITEHSMQDSDSDSDSDTDSDSEPESDLDSESELEKTKFINVDLSIPDNYELDVDELDADELDMDADELDMDVEEDNEDHVEIIVNKLDEVTEMTESNEIKNSDGITLLVEKDSYKKMNLPALRSFIISKGYQTDSAKLQKMKKGELIDLIVSSQQSDKE